MPVDTSAVARPQEGRTANGRPPLLYGVGMDQGTGDSPATTLGGFFALRTLRQGQHPPAEAVPLATVYGKDDRPLAARVSQVRSRLGTTEDRVAASIAYLGLAARIWSIALAPTVLDRVVPDLSPSRLYWDPSSSTPDDLWLTPAHRQEPTAPPSSACPPSPSTATLTTELTSLVYEAHLVPLVAATRRVCRVSERLLWGNAASALGGTLQQLSGWCEQRALHDEARLSRQLTEILAHGQLRGTGTLLDPLSKPTSTFRRSTCCLYYRAPGGGLCGDCVFQGPQGPKPPKAVPRGDSAAGR